MDVKVRHRSACQRIQNALKKDIVLLMNIIGIILGFIIGLSIRILKPSQDALMWVGKSIYTVLISCCKLLHKPSL